MSEKTIQVKAPFRRPRVALLPGRRRGLRLPRQDRKGQDPPRDGNRGASRLDGAAGALPLDGALRDVTNADLVILDEFGKWGTVLADDKLAAAMIDRVVHHSRLVEFNGTNHRMDQALMLSGNAS